MLSILLNVLLCTNDICIEHPKDGQNQSSGQVVVAADTNTNDVDTLDQQYAQIARNYAERELNKLREFANNEQQRWELVLSSYPVKNAYIAKKWWGYLQNYRGKSTPCCDPNKAFLLTSKRLTLYPGNETTESLESAYFTAWFNWMSVPSEQNPQYNSFVQDALAYHEDLISKFYDEHFMILSPCNSSNLEFSTNKIQVLNYSIMPEDQEQRGFLLKPAEGSMILRYIKLDPKYLFGEACEDICSGIKSGDIPQKAWDNLVHFIFLAFGDDISGEEQDRTHMKIQSIFYLLSMLDANPKRFEMFFDNRRNTIKNVLDMLSPETRNGFQNIAALQEFTNCTA